MSMPAVEWPEAEQRIAEASRNRRGRHRDRALASWRRARAIELRASGCSYEEIAREVGYTSRATAFNVVTAALAAREAEGVDLLRRVEQDRLDALLRSLWARAREGDVATVLAALRVIEQQIRLAGLAPSRVARADPKAKWPSCHGPATVVLHPDDCRHNGCSKHGSF